MTEKTTDKVIEGTIVNDATESKTEKKSRIALAGVKKGAAAAKQAVNTIAAAPSKILDSTVYGACYGISYGAVFSTLMVVKILPADGLVIKGFQEGSKAAHNDFKTHEQKHTVAEKHGHKHAAKAS